MNDASDERDAPTDGGVTTGLHGELDGSGAPADGEATGQRDEATGTLGPLEGTVERQRAHLDGV